MLAAEPGLVHYRYPLNTEKFSTQPLEQVTVSVEVESRDPIQAVYSPTHDVDSSARDAQPDRQRTRPSNVLPDRDFELYYSIGDDRVGLPAAQLPRSRRRTPASSCCWPRRPSSADSAQSVPKDVLLVLDRSGSMDGEKFEQAQAGGDLRPASISNPKDRFNLIAFSTATEAYAAELRPAGEAPRAVAWVEQLAARGSTDINRALLEAAAQPTANAPPRSLPDRRPAHRRRDRQRGDPRQPGELRPGQLAPVRLRRRL